MENSSTLKDVYTISEKEGGTAGGGKEYWTKIGVAFVNRDDSINVVLDATPINGRLHIRDRRPSVKQNQQ